MTADDLVKEAAQRGLRIIIDGMNLRVRPGRLCPRDFADALRARKPELLALLADASADITRVKRSQRPLTDREWAILVRTGAKHNPLIIEALNLFDGRIVDLGEK
jgi:hypothetical protein